MILEAGWMSYVYLFAVGALVTAPWRFAGVFLARGIDMESEILKWVNAVSVALVAGLVTRLVIFPVGALAEMPLWLRASAFLFGLAVFLSNRRFFALGIVSGTAVLLLGSQFI